MVSSVIFHTLANSSIRLASRMVSNLVDDLHLLEVRNAIYYVLHLQHISFNYSCVQLISTQFGSG